MGITNLNDKPAFRRIANAKPVQTGDGRSAVMVTTTAIDDCERTLLSIYGVCNVQRFCVMKKFQIDRGLGRKMTIH